MSDIRRASSNAASSSSTIFPDALMSPNNFSAPGPQLVTSASSSNLNQTVGAFDSSGEEIPDDLLNGLSLSSGTPNALTSSGNIIPNAVGIPGPNGVTTPPPANARRNLDIDFCINFLNRKCELSIRECKNVHVTTEHRERLKKVCLKNLRNPGSCTSANCFDHKNYKELMIPRPEKYYEEIQMLDYTEAGFCRSYILNHKCSPNCIELHPINRDIIKMRDVCLDFLLTGNCPNGPLKCSKSHKTFADIDVLPPSAYPNKYPKNELCIDWLNNNCQDTDCKWIHVEEKHIKYFKKTNRTHHSTIIVTRLRLRRIEDYEYHYPEIPGSMSNSTPPPLQLTGPNVNNRRDDRDDDRNRGNRRDHRDHRDHRDMYNRDQRDHRRDRDNRSGYSNRNYTPVGNQFVAPVMDIMLPWSSQKGNVFGPDTSVSESKEYVIRDTTPDEHEKFELEMKRDRNVNARRRDWNDFNRRIFDKTGGYCYNCRGRLVFENRTPGFNGGWTKDHILPIAKYPELDILENLLPTHFECSSERGPQYLQSIMNEDDFDHLTSPLLAYTLDPRAHAEIENARAAYHRINDDEAGRRAFSPAIEPPTADAGNDLQTQVGMADSVQFDFENKSPLIQTQQLDYSGERERQPTGLEVVRSSSGTSQGFDDALKLLSQQYLVDYSSLKFGTPREEIGRGTFGVVYKAKLDGTPVAVKELLPINDQVFKKEVGMLISFRHQNIVLLTGFCKAPNCFCIITELFEKRSLQHLLENREEKIDNDRCLNFALDIARGMNYLHKRNVLHLDLKPLNVLVDSGYICKVSDFGLSKVAIKIAENNSLHATNTGAGTPVYMAPEVFMANNVGSKADVYSFGIIMWQLATRETPFSEFTVFKGNPYALAVKVINERLRPKLPPRAFYGYASLMEKCWQHDPNERPDFETIIECLEDMIKSPPII